MKFETYSEGPHAAEESVLQMFDRGGPLEALVYPLLHRGYEITFGPGVDDNEEVDSLFIEVEKDGESAGKWYATLPEVKARYQNLRSIGAKVHENMKPRRILRRMDEWYDALSKECRMKPSERRGINVIRDRYAMKFVVAHAINLGGFASLSIGEDAETGEDAYATLTYGYHHPSGLFGWGGLCEVRLPIAVAGEATTKGEILLN